MKCAPCLVAAAFFALAALDVAAMPDDAQPAANPVAEPILPLQGGLAPSKRSGDKPREQAIKDYYRGPRGEEWS